MTRNITDVHLPIPPPRVDSSKGPRWTGWGGPKKYQFWPDLAIQPIKKSIGVPHLSTRHVSRPFNLIGAHPEWTDREILDISDFWKKKLCLSHGPLFWTPRQHFLGVMGLFFGPLGQFLMISGKQKRCATSVRSFWQLYQATSSHMDPFQTNFDSQISRHRRRRTNSQIPT